MKLHGNARLSVHGRRLLVERVCQQGWTQAAAAEAAGVSTRTVAKWVARWRLEGTAGLRDRSSPAHCIPHRTAEDRVVAIAALRRLWLTAAEIAELLEMPLSTVSVVLARIGLGRRSQLEPPESGRRYQRERPGELVHIDVKKLGRIEHVGHRITGDRRRRVPERSGRRAGWEFVHVCVDDATRMAYVEVLADERTPSVLAFLRRAVAWFARRGVRVERVMTDNGSAYRSAMHAVACRLLGIRHLRTKPYRPQTNGKAERFIRTLLGGWAYAAVYPTSRHRTNALPGWIDFYNHRRRHGSLSRQTPAERLAALMNNPPGTYT